MGRSRSAGAAVWATVLSELAGVVVSMEWESGSWHARWVDGPSRALLLDRATALGGYGVGAPLLVNRIGFARRVSPVATAAGWLVHGGRATDAEERQGLTAGHAVEHWCDDTNYPLQQVGADLLAAARLLAAVSHQDPATMAALMTAAWPPVPPAEATGRVIDVLPGRVVSFRWPGRGGPPRHLLEPTTTVAAPAGPDRPLRTPAMTAPTAVVAVCRQCGDVLPARPGGRGGRPAEYCSDRCRVAAYRKRKRTSLQSFPA